MKIEYHILWFEDQFSEMTATIDAVRGLLDELGFKLIIQREEIVTTQRVEMLAEQLDSYNPYDLILFDFNLGKDDRSSGLEIARLLRRNMYSDMVFYSAKSRKELRQMLFDERVEGVFTAGRYSFPDDVEPIIQDQIKRISDVNMMRGIVMDEVSRFDRLLRELCLKLLKSADLDSAKQSLCRRMAKNGESLVKKSKKIDCPTMEYSDVRRTTFDLVKRGLVDMLDGAGGGGLREALGEGGLLHSLQKLRNRLAHVEGKLDEKGIMTLVDDEREQFDFEHFVQIRKDLQEAGQLIQNEIKQ